MSGVVVGAEQSVSDAVSDVTSQPEENEKPAPCARVLSVRRIAPTDYLMP